MTRQGATLSLFLAVLLTVALSACDAERSHIQKVEAWHADRIDRLTAPDGWLTVVGLFWLQEGVNTIGSDDGSDIRFPEDRAPGHLGTFLVAGDSVRASLAPASGVQHTGVEADTIGVFTDAHEEPTVFELGSLSWYVIDREGRLGVRLQDTSSVARKTFSGIERYPVGPEWRVRGRFVPYTQPRPMEVPTVLETPATLTTPGAVEFELNGETHRLDVVGEADAARLWIIFADPTNRSETYPAGRYVYIDAPSPGDDEVEIDFNVAYNPPCAFSDYATCPFPPPQNRLSVPIEAGEKHYDLHASR